MLLGLVFLSFIYVGSAEDSPKNDLQFSPNLEPSLSNQLFPPSRRKSVQSTTGLPEQPFFFSGPSIADKDASRKRKKYQQPTEYLMFPAPTSTNDTESPGVTIPRALIRRKRNFGMGGGSMGMGGSREMGANQMGQTNNMVFLQPAPVQSNPNVMIQGPDGQLTSLGAGTYTFAGGITTSFSNGYAYTLSTYTRIVNGIATIGTVTLVPQHTYFNNRLLQPNENPYGVPNVGTYTLPGTTSVFVSQGYPYTVSSYTKIVDGVATFAAVTLAGVQTYYNNRLLQPGENPYGVPNQGTYTLPGSAQVTYLSGYPMTVSTFTKIVDGVATFMTSTVGGLMTYYNGRLLQPGENAYGVPNTGTYTLPGPMSTFNDQNGYPVTVSSYTKIVDGRATFGAVTTGAIMTYFDNKILRPGENPFGVPNQGTYTLPGSVQVRVVNGQTQTLSTYTKVIDGKATYGTVTQMQMQTIFVPAGQMLDSNRNLVVKC